MTSHSSPDFDLIIIGAGINGSGIARDAAMRGLSVLLIDKGDISSGTSAFSTRLIHGGLRYLEHGEIGLVRESLRERETLLHIAPHLVRPLPLLIPIYDGAQRGPLTMRAGMVAYDLLSLGKTLPRHRHLSRAKTLAREPGLNPQGLSCAAVYYDAQVEFAERLVLENALSSKMLGAKVVTYAKVTRVIISDGAAQGIEFLTSNGENREARGSVIVNTAGPWLDDLACMEGTRLIGGTKGSHIVVRPFNGAPTTAVYVEAQLDQRPFFVIPWNDNFLIGTTDVRVEESPDKVHCEPWEVDYLLNETNRVFPSAALTTADVCYTYSGVRPLAFTDDKDEQSITRRHFIRRHPQFNNLLSIVGGKLTTYRSLSEECVDLVFGVLGKRSPSCTTSQVPLPGAEDLAELSREFQHESNFSEAINNRLLKIYGSRATEVAKFCSQDVALSQPFNKGANVLAGEVLFSFECELAQTLADCLLRRTMLGLDADRAIGDYERAAEIAMNFLGWTSDRGNQEVELYRASITRTHPTPSEASASRL